jgi:hypothetical protein
MVPSSPLESRRFAFLGGLFILFFFMLFSYRGLLAYFTFDDGTAVVANLGHFEVPTWRNILHILTVFTAAYRPLSTMFWRPLYAMFGYNPMPYRIVVHILLVINIWLTYTLIKRMGATREVAALSTLIFCYNASMGDLYYDTCTVTDVLCFLFYILAASMYVKGRQTGYPLSLGRAIAVMVSFMLALDSKELAVALPGILVMYELFFRRADFTDKQKAMRIAGMLALMFLVDALFLKVKVADMGQNPAYHPHVTFGFMLKNFSVYLRELFYLPENTISPQGAVLILAGILAIGALVRSWYAVFGGLFFIAALIPVAVIPPRSGYCAYIPYFGLALAFGAILGSARSILARKLQGAKWESRSILALFVVTAFFLAKAHMAYWARANGYYEWSKPQVIGLYDNFQRTFPEFPPGARILLAEDPWGGDWGPMFLVQLMYHDKTVWIDRPKNYDHPPDPATYDTVVKYKPGNVDLTAPRLFGIFKLKWAILGTTTDPGEFVVTSPNAHGAASHIDFAPPAVRNHQPVTVTVPGLSNTAVNVVFRIVTGSTSTTHPVQNFCNLDAKGTCTITAQSDAPTGTVGAMVIDWIQPANQHWILTTGVLTVVN